MTQAETLAMELIARPMTKVEICEMLGSKEEPTSPDYAADVITRMRRKVLPELGAWCPRPTHADGYIYRVIDKKPDADNLRLTLRGAEMMVTDNTRRLITMKETAEPYMNVLNDQTKQGKAAKVVVDAANLAIAALAMIE